MGRLKGEIIALNTGKASPNLGKKGHLVRINCGAGKHNDGKGKNPPGSCKTKLEEWLKKL